MTIGSLFDGSGTAPLAATMLGGTPLWASEIEPYPVAVTKARFPDMKHLGDITKINGAEIDPVDVIVGGSPCQDLSVAGKQAGLEDGTRSNRFYDMTRIVREMRGATNGTHPRFVVWENVPGAFSSNKGRDFLAVVSAFCALADDGVHIPEPERAKTGRLVWRNAGAVVGDGWSFAWRVLDAQFWGVPQRRRRIFAVLDLGSGRAGEILFERARLPWDSEPRGAEGEGVAADAVGCADRGGGIRCLNPWDCQSKRIFEIDGIYPTLPAMDGGGANNQAVIYPVGAFCAGAAPAAGSIGYSERVAPTLKSAQCAFPMGAVVYEPMSLKEENWAEADAKNALRANASKSAHVVVQDAVYALQGSGIDRSVGAVCNGAGWREDVMYTLNTIDRPAVVYDARGNGDGEIVGTLTGDHQNRVTDYTSIACFSQERHGQYSKGDSASTQLARQYKSPTDLVVEKRRRYVVRRLTPLECTRLQGFPDWWVDGIAIPNPTEEGVAFWTDVWETHRKATSPSSKPKTRKQIIKWLSAPGSDSNEYKMWGNGMALPCMLAVLSGIKEVIVHG